jgi:hypothetical protein
MGRPPDCHCHCGAALPPSPVPGASCPDCPGNHAQYQTGTEEKMLVIQVCNTNSSPDDTFVVSLNGTVIDGALELGFSSKVGAIYKTQNVTIDDDDPLLLCPNQSHDQNPIGANLLLAYPSSNVITSTQGVDNGQGNFGGIRVISYDYPYVAGEGCVVEDFEYGSAPWNYSFDLCEVPKTVTLSVSDDNSPISHGYVVSIDSVNYGYQGSVDKTAGDTVVFEFISTGLHCRGGGRKVLGGWFVKVGSGPWTNTGQLVAFPLHYTMPNDTLDVWPDHGCAFA